MTNPPLSNLYGEQGLILVHVPAGSHIVTIKFEDTPPRQIGAILSVVSTMLALLLLTRSRNESRIDLL